MSIAPYIGLDAQWDMQGDAQDMITPAELAKALARAPVHAYRWTLKPFIGHECRHLPTCSEYALDAIALNGAWRGAWLAAGRISRCHPWGTSGFDPVPDIRAKHHPLAPWRYAAHHLLPGARPDNS